MGTLLTVSEAWSIIIIVWSMLKRGRHGAEEAVESCILVCRQRERQRLGLA